LTTLRATDGRYMENGPAPFLRQGKQKAGVTNVLAWWAT